MESSSGIVGIEDHELLCMVARLYYVDGLSQGDVARMANVSQAKISRLLAKAREKGIVSISVAEYEPRNRQLETLLEKRLGVRRAVVIKVAKGLPVRELRQSVAHFAAPGVAAMIRSGDILALAGGRTIQWLVHSLQPQAEAHGLTVVQAMGCIDDSVGPYDALELGRRVARCWNGAFFTLDTPTLLPNARIKSNLLALSPIQLAMEQLQRARIALVGIGTLKNSVFVERNVLGQADIKRIQQAGCVGEICGRFFDCYGHECETPYRDCAMSIELKDLKNVEEVVAVVAGSDRTEAIRGALQGGLIKSLVMDEIGAAALLAESNAEGIG